MRTVWFKITRSCALPIKLSKDIANGMSSTMVWDGFQFLDSFYTLLTLLGSKPIFYFAAARRVELRGLRVVRLKIDDFTCSGCQRISTFWGKRWLKTSGSFLEANGWCIKMHLKAYCCSPTPACYQFLRRTYQP